MNATSIRKVYFSATGTTEKLVNAVGDALAACMKVGSTTYDFTLPEHRQAFPLFSEKDLVVFGCPTYAGRLPNVLLKFLDTLCGGGALAVPIVTFGNRHFDNSLIELGNLLEAHGFRTVAAGAFACEHSFSYRLGAGRPDAADLDMARHFARDVFRKISAPGYGLEAHEAVRVEGDATAGYYQPRDRDGKPIDIRKAKPLTRDHCDKCGLCATICPMGSISAADTSQITGICIKCGACIKKCPRGAKYFDHEGYLYHKSELETLYRQPAENRVFL